MSSTVIATTVTDGAGRAGAVEGWPTSRFSPVLASSAEDVAAAVDRARAAFEPWSALAPSARRDLLDAAAGVLGKRAEEFAAYLLHETAGRADWAAANIRVTATHMRSAAAAALTPFGELPASDRAGQWSLAVRQPVGVVAAITPWNAPLILCARAVIVALAVGNAVLLRPSEEAPISAGLFLADVLREGGLPDGVLQVLVNDRRDAPTVIEALIAHPDVRRVNFTGSTEIGRIIGRLAGEHLTPALLELGGKNPAIVLDDADIEHAASMIVYSRYSNSGQICLSVDRVIMHEAIARELTARLLEKVKALATGRAEDPATIVGPLISEQAAERVQALVDDAVSRGARLLVGGGPRTGRLYPPTMLAGITPQMRIYREETFGPVATLFTVADDEQAVNLANDTDYGLTSAVFSGDSTRALALARRLQHGCTHVNSHTLKEEPEAPMGGMKDSGYGSFGGPNEIDFFTQMRWITLSEYPDQLPSWALSSSSLEQPNDKREDRGSER